jgi:hypothetical protein
MEIPRTVKLILFLILVFPITYTLWTLVFVHIGLPILTVSQCVTLSILKTIAFTFGLVADYIREDL